MNRITGAMPTFKITPARANYALAALGVISLLNYGDRIIIAVLLEPIKEEFGSSDAQLGLLTGFAFAIFYGSFAIPLARLADSKNRVALLSIVIALWSLMTALSGAAQNFAQLLLARIGVGIGQAGCVPASHSLISDYFLRERRVFALGMFHAAGSIGVLAFVYLAGLIAETLNWRWAFCLLGMPGVLVAIIVWFTVREPPRGSQDPGFVAPVKSLHWHEAFPILLRRSTFVQVIAGIALSSFTFLGVAQWIPAFLVRSHDMPLDQIGLSFGLAMGVGLLTGQVLGSLTGPWLVGRDRRWECWLPALAYALAVPMYILAFIATSPYFALFMVFMGMLAGGLSYGPMLASIQSVSEPYLRATAVSLSMFFSALIGQGAGPFFIGYISDILTPAYGDEALRIALILSTVVMAWGALHFYLASRTFNLHRLRGAQPAATVTESK
jgi:MFS family permease